MTTPKPQSPLELATARSGDIPEHWPTSPYYEIKSCTALTQLLKDFRGCGSP